MFVWKLVHTITKASKLVWMKPARQIPYNPYHGGFLNFCISDESYASQMIFQWSKQGKIAETQIRAIGRMIQYYPPYSPVLPLSYSVHQPTPVMVLRRYTWRDWRRISVRGGPYIRKILITLRSSMFDHLSVAAVTLQIILREPDAAYAAPNISVTQLCSMQWPAIFF